MFWAAITIVFFAIYFPPSSVEFAVFAFIGFLCTPFVDYLVYNKIMKVEH
jgi:hypothetical protein